MEFLFTLIWIGIFIWIAISFINFVTLKIGQQIHDSHMKEYREKREEEYQKDLAEFNSRTFTFDQPIRPQSYDSWIPYEEYQAYLQSPEWRNKARERMALDNHTCQYCGSELLSRINENHIPNVHHLHYRTLRNECVNTDLVTLCQECHTNLHIEHSIPEMEVMINSKQNKST